MKSYYTYPHNSPTRLVDYNSVVQFVFIVFPESLIFVSKLYLVIKKINPRKLEELVIVIRPMPLHLCIHFLGYNFHPQFFRTALLV